MKHLTSAKKSASGALLYGSTFFYLQFAAWKVAAQEGFGGEIPDIPGTAQGGSGETRDSIVTVINFILTFLALIAVVFVIVGGFRILAAGGNEENVTKGRKTIIYAIIGLIIIFFARVIVGFFTDELASEFT